jgi:hypothetical protein
MIKLILFFNIIFSSLPFISFGVLNLDTQPYVYLISILYIVATIPTYKIFAPELAIPIVGLGIGLSISPPPTFELFFRATLSYIAPLILINTYINTSFDNKKKILSNKTIDLIFKISVSINLLSGLIQTFISKTFFDALVLSRTSDSRGVTALFNEPSSYGLAMLVCLLYLLISRPPGMKLFGLLSLFQIFFLSQSSLAILTLTLIAGAYIVIFRPKLILLLPIILFMVAASINTDANISDSRTLNIIEILLERPTEFFLLDGSINERFYHVLTSLKSYGAPMGFNSFIFEINSISQKDTNFWYGEPTNKIVSGIGASFWEIGLFGLAYLLYPVILTWRQFGYKQGVFVGISILLIFIHNISFNHPYYSLFCASLFIGCHSFTKDPIDNCSPKK